MNRQEDYEVSERFMKRWSPRSFDSSSPLYDEDIHKLFEAARWSPSSFNHQPWTFLYAHKGDDYYETYLSLLNDFNKEWAAEAPLIGFIVAHLKDPKGNENRHALFDCGAAWMALTMQARDLGLYTHGMGGIHYESCYEKLEIPNDEYQVVCAFVVGKKGPAKELPDDLKKEEKMNERLGTDEISFNGKFKRRKTD